MKKWGVLVFPAGEINSIELHDSLCSCVNIELWGASSIERHGKYVFKNYVSGLPLISNDNFLKEFNKLIDEKGIDIIFPTHDTVACYLAEHEKELHAQIVCGDKRSTDICRSKKKTYQLFGDTSFVPEMWSTIDEIKEYPVFIKPDAGQGSIGTKLINKKDDFAGIDIEEKLILEYLPGKEITVDCFTDKDGLLRGIFPRCRERVLAGICVHGSIMCSSDEISHIAQIINSRMCFKGLWYFQLKQDKYERFKLLEVSCRCSGTMCLTRARGINLPLLSVYTNMGLPVELENNLDHIEMDRTFISRYCSDIDYQKVYIDYDDTIIVDHKVNLDIIRYLYQCKNNGKEIILLTKHCGDLQEDLEKYAISEKIFTQVIHLDDDIEKASVINKEKSIFIDNSYKERKAVKAVSNIPVFDVEGVEVLLDWRK